MRKGSAEWASTMHNIRKDMNDILEDYPELRKYTENINGV
jgi:hypothetical protein